MNPLESRRLRKFTTVALIAVGVIGLAGCTQSLPHPELSLPFSQGESAQATSTPTTKPLFEANQEFLVQSIGPVNLPIPVPEGYQDEVIPGTLLFIRPETLHLPNVQWNNEMNPHTAATQESSVVGLVTMDFEGRTSAQAFVFTEKHALKGSTRNPANLQPDPSHPVFLYIPNDSRVNLNSETLTKLRQSHFGDSTLNVQTPLDRADLTTGIGYVNLVTNKEGETVLTAPGGPLGTNLRIPIPEAELQALEVYQAQQTPFAEVVQTIQAKGLTATPSPTMHFETPTTLELTPDATETVKRIQTTIQGGQSNSAEPTRTPVTQVTPPATFIGTDGSVWKYNKSSKVYDRVATEQTSGQQEKTASPTPSLTPTSTPKTMEITEIEKGTKITESQSPYESNPLTSIPALALYAAAGLTAAGFINKFFKDRKKAKEAAAWNKRVEDRTNTLMGFPQNKTQLEALTQVPREHQIRLLMDIAQLSEEAQKKEKAGHLIEAITLKKQRDILFKEVDMINATIQRIETDFRAGLRKEAEKNILKFQKQLRDKTI